MTSSLLLCLMLAAPPAQLSGVVRDASGAVVTGASVIVRSAASGEQRTTTGPDGRFQFAVPEAQLVEAVRKVLARHSS